MSNTVIIGAGITGAYTAFLLADSGHKVTLLDAGSLAYRGTSCNPGGINPLHGPGLPDPMAGFYLSCHSYHGQHKDRIQQLSGIDYDYRVIDRLFLAFTEEEKAKLLDMMDAYNASEGFSASWYGKGELAGLDSRISDQALGGLMTRGNVVVDSELYCEALRLAAVGLGARYVEGNVDEIVTRDQEVTHVVACGERIACSAAILATGCWTEGLSRELGAALPVSPVKGELLLVSLADKPFDFDITWGLTGLYHCSDNRYWLGGTTDDPTIDPGITEQGKEKILGNMKLMLPGLKQISLVDHCAGYRPVAPDKLPLIGRVPGYGNIYVGTGGGSKGILVSSGIGKGILDLIEGRDVDVPQFLTPERFHDKN